MLRATDREPVVGAAADASVEDDDGAGGVEAEAGG